MNTKTRAGWLAGAVAVASMMLSACSSASPDPSTSGTPADDVTPTELSIVAFSVPQAANQAVQAAFAKTDAGAGVTWAESYGASGDQSRAVESGQAADYVHFSLESDVTRLVDAGLVDASWNTGPTKGIVTSSVVVFAVRPGNPKNIHTGTTSSRTAFRSSRPPRLVRLRSLEHPGCVGLGHRRGRLRGRSQGVHDEALQQHRLAPRLRP